MFLTAGVSSALTDRYGGKKAFLRHCGYQLRSRLGAYDVYRLIRWQDVRRICFVCKGNICRSPFAEALARIRGLDAHSCGLDLTEGSPAHPFAAEVARGFGADLSRHRSRKFVPLEMGHGDLIVVMEPTQAEHVRSILPPSVGAQLTILGLWADRPRPYIHDPYGQARPYFDECFRIIEGSVGQLGALIGKHRSLPEDAATQQPVGLSLPMPQADH